MVQTAKKAGVVPKEVEESGEVEEKRPTGFYVADNTAITSKRGVLDAGTQIRESDLPGGKSALAALLKNGVVVEEK